MNSIEIRNKFLNFFKEKNHQVVQSYPLVLKNDPSLMFVNAGMVPFKEYFLGDSKIKENRITDTQKCLRVSGKHNDLEEVGYDTYHHTLFEMLGNWSFGDYFKEEAIAWAWELLTEVYKIDKNILYVTIFEGDKSDNLERDNEAYNIWKNYISEDRILLGNKKDNFWEMGEQGPCGPCSEIHVDIRSDEEKQKIDGKTLVNEDHPQVVEIWNLVFMQFNRKANGSLENLPNKHVDTGMGFERLCMVLQDKKSNYDTDVFTPLIREIETITKSDYNKNEKNAIAIRVIADHVRAVAFAIADGQLPSNSGAGYVIRRILRRAIRYGFSYLNKKTPFIYQLVDTLENQFKDVFPEISSQKNLVVNVIKEEEVSFLRTLDQGLILLDNIIKTNKKPEISGQKVFELKDTFGFPEDLTDLILRENNLTYNKEEFSLELEKQKERARKATATITDDWTILLQDDEQEFVGYDTLNTKVKIAKYRKVETKKEGELYQIVLNLTPFYAESGGQVGDKGYLKSENGDLIYIIDTKKENNLNIHITKDLPNNLTSTFEATVDKNQRYRTAANHSATHLLHQGLREVLGAHVEQKGSMVHSGYLRFDFSHFTKVSAEEIHQIENFVNARIREQIPLVEKRDVPYDDAIKNGAIALFGEKYSDAVRTINFGESTELCGGTHIKNTNEIWHFIIKNESAVASGIRRIEAISNDAAKTYFSEQLTDFKNVKQQLKNPKDTLKSIQNLQQENSELKKQIENLIKEKAKNLKQSLKSEITSVNNINFLATKVELDPKSIKNLAFELGGELDDLFLLFGYTNKDKAMISCYISKNLVADKNLNANTFIKELGQYINGSGGGQPFFATAGGTEISGLETAINKAKDLVQNV